MQKFIFTILSLFVAGYVSAKESPFTFSQKIYTDTTVAQRGWGVRASYNRQSGLNVGEFGFGRVARLQHFDEWGKDVTSASATFTFGGEFAYDSTLIAAPKLAFEFAATAFGARVGYAYYMQDNQRSGVICIEGGLNIVSRFFIYGGYNFVRKKWDSPVIAEGPRFSVGMSFPFGMRRVKPPASPTHL